MAGKQRSYKQSKGREVEKETLNSLLEKAKDSEYNPQAHKDKTRSEIALFFVKAYIALIIFIFVAVFTYNLVLLTIHKESFVLDIKDIFPLVIGTVGTLLGFVLGYYFKSQERE